MKNLVRIVGAIAATAFAIAPLVTPLNAKAGAIIAIIAAGAAAFGPALIDKRRARKTGTANRRAGGRSQFGSLLLLFILPLALLSSACGDGVKVAKQAAQGMAVSAVALDEGIQLKRDLRMEGQLSREAELEITRTMLDIDRSLIEITDTAKCFGRYTSDVRTNLINASSDVITSLERLNRNGVLHIRSPEGQRRFRAWILGARFTARGLRAALVSIEAQDPPTEGETAPQLTLQQREAIYAVQEICERASRQLHANETQLLNDIALLENPSEQS